MAALAALGDAHHMEVDLVTKTCGSRGCAMALCSRSIPSHARSVEWAALVTTCGIERHISSPFGHVMKKKRNLSDFSTKNSNGREIWKRNFVKWKRKRNVLCGNGNKYGTAYSVELSRKRNFRLGNTKLSIFFATVWKAQTNSLKKINEHI